MDKICKRLDELSKRIQALEEATMSLQNEKLSASQVDDHIAQVLQEALKKLS